MQKYAAWKAADINKALREGRQPTPGSSSSPVVAEADLDAQPPEPRSAAEPDFAFPSAPAKDVEAPSFPSSTAQGALGSRPAQLHYVKWHLHHSHHAAGTVQALQWRRSLGLLQAADALLVMPAMTSQTCRHHVSSLRPPTSPLRPRDLCKPRQQVSLPLIQINPGMREDRRSCTMPSTRAFLFAVLWPRCSDQV